MQQHLYQEFENTQKKKVKLQVKEVYIDLWGKTRDGTKTCP